MINKLPPYIILYGGTGLAKMLRETVEYYGSNVIAVIDDTPDLPSPFSDIPIYQGWDNFKSYFIDRKNTGFLIAIGNPHGRIRLKLHDKLIVEGLQPITIAHKTAWIAENAKIGEGTQIDAGAIIMAEAVIGRQCIIGPQTNVSHEVVLEDGVDTTVGTTICGNVHIGKCAWICAGATIFPKIKIGADAVVGAGAVVRKDVPEGITVLGNPAKPIKRKR